MTQLTMNGVDQIKFSPDALRRVRERRGLTQDEVAAELGVSGQAVSSWERGLPMWSTNRHKVEEWLRQYWHATGRHDGQTFTLKRCDAMPLRFTGNLLARNGDCALYRTRGGSLVVQADNMVWHGKNDAAVVDEAVGNLNAPLIERIMSMLHDRNIGVCEEIE